MCGEGEDMKTKWLWTCPISEEWAQCFINEFAYIHGATTSHKVKKSKSLRYSQSYTSEHFKLEAEIKIKAFDERRGNPAKTGAQQRRAVQRHGARRGVRPEEPKRTYVYIYCRCGHQAETECYRVNLFHRHKGAEYTRYGHNSWADSRHEYGSVYTNHITRTSEL